MEPQQLKSALESILFVSGKPLSVRELAKITETETAAVKAALSELAAERKHAGVVLLEHEEVYQLATNSRNSAAVKNFLNAELREKLTDATVEVLAIVAYRQPIAKAEIEAIRGVNSQYSLRVLLMRGLIEKIANPNDARGVLYQTTTEFLQHLGLSSLADLPEFQKLVADIKLPETPALQPSAAGSDDQAAEQTAPSGDSAPGEIVITETSEPAADAEEDAEKDEGDENDADELDELDDDDEEEDEDENNHEI